LSISVIRDMLFFRYIISYILTLLSYFSKKKKYVVYS